MKSYSLLITVIIDINVSFLFILSIFTIYLVEILALDSSYYNSKNIKFNKLGSVFQTKKFIIICFFACCCFFEKSYLSKKEKLIEINIRSDCQILSLIQCCSFIIAIIFLFAINIIMVKSF